MKILICSVLLLLTPITSLANECPWKLSQVEREIDSAAEYTEDAWSDIEDKDRDLAKLRRKVIVDCSVGDRRERLSAFKTSPEDFDITAEVAKAELFSQCIDEKRVEANAKLAKMQAAGNKLARRFELTIIPKIDAVGLRTLDHRISINQLASKIRRLETEKNRLLETCDLFDI